MLQASKIIKTGLETVVLIGTGISLVFLLHHCLGLKLIY